MTRTSRWLATCSLALLCSAPATSAAGAPLSVSENSVSAVRLSAGKQIEQIIVDHKSAHPEIVGEAITVVTPKWSWSGATGGIPGSKERLTERHLFRIASVSKPFVAAAVLRLMEMGKVDITRAIDLYISDDTAKRLRSGGYDPALITVRQLLSHTSGICNFAGTAQFMAVVERDPQHRWTRGEQIQLAADHCKAEGAAGTVFAYSDTGYIILGEIIERETGKMLGPAVRDLINYKAIGLTDTYWEQTEPRPRAARFSGAMLDGIDMTAHDHSFDLYGGGGLISTTSDLARFFQALVEGRIFRQKRTLAALLAVPSVRRSENLPLMANGVILYPLGRFICIGHSGFWGQFVAYCPENGVAIAWSTNNNRHTTMNDSVIQKIIAVLDMK